MRNTRKFGLVLVAMLAAMLLGLTAVQVFANGTLTISSFFVENGVAKVQIDNGAALASVKYHLYVNGNFHQWGTEPVADGQQELSITVVNPPSAIDSAEIVIFKDQQQDEQLASKYWDGNMPTPTSTPTSSPTAIPTDEPTQTPVPTGTPVAPVASEIAFEVITDTVKVTLSAEAEWQLYLDGTFNRYGRGTEFVVGLLEFNESMEVVTNAGTEVQRNMFKPKAELLQPEPTQTPVPTGTPVAPVASEIAFEVITDTVKVTLSAEADWQLYLDGTFNRYGRGTEFVVGLLEFNESMEVVSNPGVADLERKLYLRRDEIFKIYMPAVSR